MSERYKVTAVDESSDQMTIEECPPSFRLVMPGGEPEPFKPEIYRIGRDPKLKLAVGAELMVTKVWKGSRRAGTLKIAGFKCRVAKKTQKQEADEMHRRHEREQQRRAALPPMKHFKSMGTGFTYRTATRPFVPDDRKRYRWISDTEIGMFVEVDIRHFDRHARIHIEQARDLGGGSHTTSSDSGRSLVLCRMDRIDHECLTAFAVALDESLPEIAALYDAGDRDGTMRIVRDKLLALVPGYDT